MSSYHIIAPTCLSKCRIDKRDFDKFWQNYQFGFLTDNKRKIFPKALHKHLICNGFKTHKIFYGKLCPLEISFCMYLIDLALDAITSTPRSHFNCIERRGSSSQIFAHSFLCNDQPVHQTTPIVNDWFPVVVLFFLLIIKEKLSKGHPQQCIQTMYSKPSMYHNLPTFLKC
jgi:hypothetical protein